MSHSASAASHGHDSGAHGGEEHPHVMPVKLYLAIWGALTFLTIITVAVAQVNLGPLNLPIALGIATFKASLVALFFMHLLWDEKFNAVVFVAALLFLAIFFSLTLIDPMTRGDSDRLETTDFGSKMDRINSNIHGQPLAAVAGTTATLPLPLNPTPAAALSGATTSTATAATSSTSTTSKTSTSPTTAGAVKK